jgi:phosphoglycolate phosphatase-like HAD superfamily hydrolase
MGHQSDRGTLPLNVYTSENQSIFSGLFPDWTEERIREVSDTKEAKFRALAASKLLPVDGLLSLTAWAKARGLLVAAVTNAPRANVSTQSTPSRKFMLSHPQDLLTNGSNKRTSQAQ